MWLGLRVYRQGNVFTAYTDRMPADWGTLYGGPYDESHICSSILGDLVGQHGMTLGEVTGEGVQLMGSVAASTNASNGGCREH